MILKIIPFLSLFCINFLYSYQVYTIDYICKFTFPEETTSTDLVPCNLIYQENISRFTYFNTQRTPNSFSDKYFYKNFNTGNILSLNDVVNGYQVVIDSLNIINWKLENSTKDVMGYECLKATAQFRSRKWEVWYTKTIPISDGPWKLNGLPGLILEAKGLAMDQIEFKVTHLEIKNSDNFIPIWNPFEEFIKNSVYFSTYYNDYENYTTNSYKRSVSNNLKENRSSENRLCQYNEELLFCNPK